VSDATAPALSLFAPGSLAGLRETLPRAFARVAPATELVFHPPAYSGLLAAQILAGARVDVFVSANRAYMADLHAAGLVPEPRVLAGNRLALVAREGLAEPVVALADFARPGLCLVVPPAATDPLGRYTEDLFAHAGLTAAIAAKRAAGEVLDELGALPRLLADGRVDAAIVYASSAPSFPASAVVPLPPDLDRHDRIAFTVGAVRRDGQRRPAADRLVDFMVGFDGQAILVAAGFLPASTVPPWDA